MSSLAWQEEWRVRPATLDDLDAAVEMFNARSLSFFGQSQTTVDDMRGWWTSPRFVPETDTRVVFDSSGRMVGWAHSGDPGEPYATIGLGVITHPDVAGCEELWDRLYAWAVERAKERLPLAAEGLRVTAFDSPLEADTARCAAARRAGFKVVRVGNRMRIDLDHEIPAPVWPEGIDVRPADLEQDIEAMCRANRESFRDHWGYVEEPFEQNLEGWRSWVEGLGDSLDPTLWFLACEGDEIAGLGLFSSQIGGDMGRSYVESLSVRPAFRKRGVALALLHHGFGEVARRGYEAVELDMDSENLTGALRLYERAGMRVIRRNLNYELVLREGTDVATRSIEA